MSISKEKIKELFTTMHLSKVRVDGELRRSARIAKRNLELLKLVPQTTIDNEEILLDQPLPNTIESILETQFNDSTPDRQPPLVPVLTHLSKQLYESISPDKREHFLELLRQDDDIINQTINNVEDTPFNQIDGSEMGVYIESWICINLCCPGCSEYSLYKYSHPNMPVIDVACVNSSHPFSSGPRYYQIKATGNTSHLKYFTRNPVKYSPTGYIKVGSKRYGHWSHEVSITDSDEDKELVIGYICISYQSLGDMKITIDPEQSFVLIPNLTFTVETPGVSYHKYYKYLYTRNSTLVSYNDKYVMAYPLHYFFSDISILKNIKIDYRFEYDKGETTIADILGLTHTVPQTPLPIPQTPLAGKRPAETSVNPGPPKRSPFNDTFYKKYLLYKSKYIHLKLASLKID